MKKKDIKKWDKKWSQIVKKGGGCEKCGKKGYLNAHHLFSRRHYSTRYNLANGICLCVSCHFDAHQSSLPFSMWIIKKRGRKWYDGLESLARKTLKQVDIEPDFKKIELEIERLKDDIDGGGYI